MTWFDDDEPAVTEAEPAASTEEEAFPSLGTVPEAPEDAPEPEEFNQIAEGLTADKENAQYTDTVLRQADDEVGGEPEPAVAAPAPEPEPVPAPEPEVTLAEAPPPAQPLASASGGQAAAAAVPAQPLGGATVQATAAVPAVAPVPAAPLASGTVPEMFANAFQASGATTLAAAGVPATPAIAPGLAPAAPSAAPALATQPTRQVATVYFADGSTRVRGADEATLLEVAYAYGATGGPIRIVGHASPGSGTARSKLANLDVSMGRAMAVARELGKLGVPPEAMTIEAAAENQPASIGDAASNRRVEIFLGG